VEDRGEESKECAKTKDGEKLLGKEVGGGKETSQVEEETHLLPAPGEKSHQRERCPKMSLERREKANFTKFRRN